MHGHVVAERLEWLPGEGVIGAFDLLQADNVGLPLIEPGLQIIHALADGIDVPGGNTHGFGGSGQGRIRLYSPYLSASAGICSGKRLYARTTGNAGARLVGESSYSVSSWGSGEVVMKSGRSMQVVETGCIL